MLARAVVGGGWPVVRSHDIEADHVLQKPVEAEDFIEFVHTVEDCWLATVRSPAASD